VSSGIGHGSSFPLLSSATGRPAMLDASTVETTGNACCPTSGTSLRSTTINATAKELNHVIGSQADNVRILPVGRFVPGYPRIRRQTSHRILGGKRPKGSAVIELAAGAVAWDCEPPQNSTWHRTEGTHTGPRSRLYPGLLMCESPSAKYSPRHACAL
jgi:hypothetical protein